ncbi:MAG TPA: ATP-binding protein [Bacteroidales bacterium]|jgi:predicted AAA+ superfamily ATPase|nr:ATP-binding protein [Bacteroidales bacterium]HOX77896.1 ATP-binding protein [Bacteroidales bacterium]
MKLITRTLQNSVEKWLFQNKVLIIYGARQVGKTTLIKQILEKFPDHSVYLNCDIFSVQQSLQTTDPERLKEFIGKARLVALDEAQRIENIGLILKILHDTVPELKIIATGSSSFDLSNKINEPLTGRAIEFILYPLSYQELSEIYSSQELPFRWISSIRFGWYPEIAAKSESDAILLLDNLTGKYLYKDIFEFETVKKPQLLVKLLQMLSLQVGSEVSVNELSVTLQVNRSTIERYLDILEKAFVIFRLYSFSRNLRQELNRKFKVYFYDVGIRNSLITNYNPPELRTDGEGLWENYFIAERLKYLQSLEIFPKRYFWRTYQGKEIDYLEETGGKLFAFECKLNPMAKAGLPKEFAASYPKHEFNVITPENYWKYLIR